MDCPRQKIKGNKNCVRMKAIDQSVCTSTARYLNYPSILLTSSMREGNPIMWSEDALAISTRLLVDALKLKAPSAGRRVATLSGRIAQQN